VSTKSISSAGGYWSTAQLATALVQVAPTNRPRRNGTVGSARQQPNVKTETNTTNDGDLVCWDG